MFKEIWSLVLSRVKPKRCRACGKPLKSHKSRKQGMGSECARAHRATLEREALERRGQSTLFDSTTNFGNKPTVQDIAAKDK